MGKTGPGAVTNGVPHKAGQEVGIASKSKHCDMTLESLVFRDIVSFVDDDEMASNPANILPFALLCVVLVGVAVLVLEAAHVTVLPFSSKQSRVIG